MPAPPDTAPCFAVAGQPILGSRSAPLYRALFARVGIHAHYTRVHARSIEELELLADELKLAGLNITSPHKRAMLSRLHSASAVAHKVGATNTVMRTARGWHGSNTDVQGVVAALELHDVSADTCRVAVLGAGGAARAVLAALARSGFEKLRLCNRGRAGAEAVALATGVPWVGLEGLEELLAHSDLFISCVPGDPDLVPTAWLRPDMVVLDADYRAQGLVRAAGLAGCRVIPGSDWLALQAAASFEAFFGQAVDSPTGAWLRLRAALEPRKLHGPILLTGFSGAGKTTAGAILAQMLGWTLVDTDLEVQREAGMDLCSLFDREGEPAFRQRERRVVAQALRQPRAVVALGGGALLHPDSLRQAQDTDLCVLLHAPLGSCLQRARGEDRPLLRGSCDPEQLWQRRRPGYIASADLVLGTADRTPQQVARALQTELDTAGVLESA